MRQLLQRATNDGAAGDASDGHIFVVAEDDAAQQ